MNQSLLPVALKERIQILDILRGFAIFGILAVNIGGFASPAFFPGYVPEYAGAWDERANDLMLLLAEGKFYTIFSFLFGLGFSVQFARAEGKGKDLKSIYPRRLWILFGLGILHSILFWYGDILRLYALLGFALFMFHNRSNRTLAIWASMLLLISFVFLTLVGGPNANEPIPGIDLVAIARETYSSASFLDVAVFQALFSPFSFFAIALFQGLSVMALFLLGLLAGRLRIFECVGEVRSQFVRVLWLGILIGLPLNALFVYSSSSVIQSFAFVFGAPVLSAAYVAGLALFAETRAGQTILTPIANVGRMALTNYVLQSLVCSLLFFGFGFGLYEQVGAAGLWGITFIIYICHIPLSVWWLAKFQFGPLEWLWRSLTYGQWQPMLKRSEV